MEASALGELARRQGAAGLTPADGVEVAAAFADPGFEYRMLTERAGVLDLAFRRRLAVGGADRISFLHAMLSNDVRSLRPGQGCPALLLTVQGRVVADCLVMVERDRVLLDTTAGRARALAEGLSRYLVADEVTIDLVGTADHAIGVFGPRAAQVLARAAGKAVPEGEPYASLAGHWEGLAFRAVALPEPRPGGFMFLIEERQAPLMWSRLVAAAQESAEGGPVGFLAYESLRLESGQPWCGLDMGEDTVALEARMERAISFTKGCYLGQEVIERVSSRGRLNRRLVGLRLSVPAAPPRGTKLECAGEEVGWLKSGGHSFKLGCAFALGYVRRGHWDPGTRLALEGKGPGSAIVVELPV